ncbi:MAG TPA: TylF/MycF/NovP-related O-methyltransferase [Patescibacteria group bacterium]|nr:TylF/MycF/NovP-related O-methyltransferase [Patescibacteria group bacterium]
MDNADSYTFHRVPNTSANRFHGEPLISDQVSKADINLIWRELEQVLADNITGAVVEFGCYVGTTSLFIRRLLNKANEQTRPFHVYDSFEGLPQKATGDASAAGVDFQAGKLAVSKKEFLRQFHIARLQPPIIHKGWFSALDDDAVPNPIAFAFLDGDFYTSILDSLKLVWPNMAPKGTILIDDYQRPELPGVEQAVHEFFQDKAMPIIRVEHNIAILRMGKS